MAIISSTKMRTVVEDSIPFDEALEVPQLHESATPLLLTKHKLIELWDSGILPPTVYAYFALQYELTQTGEVEVNFDAETFIFNWRGMSDPDTGKCKELKPKQVAVAIHTLQEKGLLRVTREQLTLDLGV